MTNYKSLLLFVFLSTSIVSNSQSTISEKFSILNTIKSPSNKRVATNEALNDLEEYLKLGNTVQLDSTSQLASITPADSTFTIFYLTSHFSNDDLQLDWIVSVPQSNQIKTYHYSQKIANSSSIAPAPQQLQASLNKYQITDTLHNYYSLTFKDNTTNKVIFSYNDVMLKTYFSELAIIQQDEEKLALNNLIDSLLQPLIYSPHFFNDAFTGFEKMGTIHSADNKVKVITWNLALDNGEYRYFGYVIQSLDANTVKVHLLKEAITLANKTENQTLNAAHWLGNEYYNIIDGKDEKNNKLYTLIGGRANGEFTKSKIIDVLWFTPSNELRLGSQLFSVGKSNPRRLIYEYSAYSSMMIRYDASSKMIVMDHLSPKSPEFQGNARFYVPDFSYDGLKFENGKWTLVSDIDLRNPNKGAVGRKPKSNKL